MLSISDIYRNCLAQASLNIVLIVAVAHLTYCQLNGHFSQKTCQREDA